MTEIQKHTLVGRGAAHDETGEPMRGYMPGRAKCSCGWVSEVLTTNNARKTAQRAHAKRKALIAEYVAESGHPAGSKFEPVQLPLVVSDDAPQTVDEEDLIGEPEPEPDSGYATIVHWPTTVAKLFFPALAKHGARLIAEARGVEHKSKETPDHTVLLRGEPSQVDMLAEQLPMVWQIANGQLASWRKTSPEYKAHDLKTNDGRKAAFAAEQAWLVDFCWVIAGRPGERTLANPSAIAAAEAYASVA